eukprot:scaffold16502_cov63-Phaeocystis_antarctica.AAC.8
MSHGLKYSGASMALLITMSGMSGPHASFDAANSIRHHPRFRHDAKSQMLSTRFECATGGTSTHIIEQRSTYAGMLSTAALRSSIMPLIRVSASPDISRWSVPALRCSPGSARTASASSAWLTMPSLFVSSLALSSSLASEMSAPGCGMLK